MRSGIGLRVLYVVYWVLALLPLIATLIAWPSLPDTIAVHFSMGGQADGWGYKGEAFIFPIAIIGFSTLMMVVSKLGSIESGNSHRNMFFATVLLTVALIIGNAICARALFYNIPSLSTALSGIGFPSAFPATCGLVLLFGGIMSHRIGQNSYTGARVPWNLSEFSWKLLQQVSGRFAIVFGAVLLVFAFVHVDSALDFWVTIIFTLMECAVVLVYGFILAKREQ